MEELRKKVEEKKRKEAEEQEKKEALRKEMEEQREEKRRRIQGIPSISPIYDMRLKHRIDIDRIA